MRELAQNVGHLRGNRRAAHPGKKTFIGRADDQVGANAAGLPAGALDLAKQYAHNRQDHRDLDRDRKNADRRPQWPMQQITDD